MSERPQLTPAQERERDLARAIENIAGEIVWALDRQDIAPAETAAKWRRIRELAEGGGVERVEASLPRLRRLEAVAEAFQRAVQGGERGDNGWVIVRLSPADVAAAVVDQK